MTKSFVVAKRTRKLKRWLKRNRAAALVICILLLTVGTVAYAQFMHTRRLTIDPTTYTPLLQLIARAESNSNYNAHFGNASNTSIHFTTMSIADVLQWQKGYVEQGNYSSAVGRYQIISTTLSGLIERLGVSSSQKFDQPTQDKLAIALLERRGAEHYINKELTADQFAANLAKEWAGLPRVIGSNPDDSYYASDSINKSRVSVSEVIKAVESLRAK